uniref:Ig-like domain-containing protein n=1 Tax=Mastacembelus armatus TaxID=205130 RepID=A0A3Q3LCM5_9TELE
MNTAVNAILILVFWIKGISSDKSQNVHQTPADLLGNINDTVKLTCRHNISSYDTVLWYHRSGAGMALKLIGFTSYTSVQVVEKPYQGHFSVSGNGEQEALLHLLKLRHPEDSGHYFCAAYNYNPVYFGSGTKLTVLESNRTISLPTVTAIQPSQRECKSKKDKKSKKTLVCVASGFYPDHVSMSWEINGEKITYGVATDNTAQRHGDYYRITSRLRVLVRPWFTSSNNFTCIVSFFDGKKTVYRSDTFESAEGPGAEFVRGDYLRITNTAKLSYVCFIIKSTIYGVFVAFLVWRIQGSSGKSNNQELS